MRSPSSRQITQNREEEEDEEGEEDGEDGDEDEGSGGGDGCAAASMIPLALFTSATMCMARFMLV
jgi:hypothetical protein